MPTRSERPTTPPPFDVVKYAKDSDARIAPARPLAPADEILDDASQELPRSETRMITRPDVAAGISNEQWASGVSGAARVAVSVDELLALPLDHRAGFLVSLVDGALDLETLVSISAMPRATALQLLRELVEAGVVAFRQS